MTEERDPRAVERPPNVVRASEVPETETRKGPFAFRRRQLGAAAGSRMLGCSEMVLPPGARSFPLHFHAANEEAIYVLEGEGTLRLGAGSCAISAGDYVALPPGEEAAHQLVNMGGEDLRYLVFSTMVAPDVTFYPDSRKLGVFVGAAPGGPREARRLTAYFPEGAAVDFWQDEDGA